MYHESYEDYIRSILGYPNYESTYNRNQENVIALESCYPEIYKVVYPRICQVCSSNTKPVTEELIEELTDEIYQTIENDNEINVTINLTNEIGNIPENRSINSANKINKGKENRGEERRFRNRTLQDLIRILLIRELLGKPGNRPPMHPNYPPMRPPFPPHPGPRPPIMPRDLYEI